MSDSQKSTTSGEMPVEVIEPDLAFIDQAKDMGGETFKQCFQCSTCAGTCPVSPENAPFPRKEMLWATWGQKEKLIKNPDIWLCHQCNDCSALCPRGARPGDVLAIMRNFAYQQYAFPRFMGKALSDVKFLIPILLLPVILIGLVVMMSGPSIEWASKTIPWFVHETYYAGSAAEPGPFSLVIIDPLFGGLFTLAILSMLFSAMRFWKDINNARPIREGLQPLSFVAAVIEAVKEIAGHGKFGDCEASKPRQLGHLLTMYGCIGLFITTGIVFVGMYFGSFVGMELHLPLKLYHPVKILGLVSAAAFAAGCYLLAYRRATDPDNAGLTNYYDWLFIAVVGTLAATGILCNVFRLMNLEMAAYATYFVHLVGVFFLLVYFPFSKFAHICYRTLAIVHAKQTRRFDVLPKSVAAPAAPAEAEGDSAA